MKILVTGFEPFGGETLNPSAEVLDALPDTIAGAEIVKIMLPVVRGEGAVQVAMALEEHQPRAVLSVGQASGHNTISLERVAINLDDYHMEDNGGNCPQDEPVVADGPDAYLCTLPVKEMVAAIRAAGIPAEVSLSAGSFVCNHVFYSLCHLLATGYPGIRAGFIRIPYLPAQVINKPGQPSVDGSLSLRAVEIAIQTMVEILEREHGPA